MPTSPPATYWPRPSGRNSSGAACGPRAVASEAIVAQSATLAPQLGEQQLGVHRADQLAQRLRAGADDLRGAVRRHAPGQPLQQDADLLRDERLERFAVTQRVVD